MKIRRPSIPPVPPDPARGRFDSAVKENLEIILGIRGTRIKPLSADASSPDIVAKINEILELLQP